MLVPGESITPRESLVAALIFADKGAVTSVDPLVRREIVTNRERLVAALVITDKGAVHCVGKQV